MKDLDKVSKDLDRIFNDIDKMFKKVDNDVDRVFKQMEKVMEEVQQGPETKISYPWKKWFAWRPVKVKGKHTWMKTVYRKEIPKTYATYDDWTRYEYGDMFDVLKDTGH